MNHVILQVVSVSKDPIFAKNFVHVQATVNNVSMDAIVNHNATVNVCEIRGVKINYLSDSIIVFYHQNVLVLVSYCLFSMSMFHGSSRV